MKPEEKHNEIRKLFANWLNAIATAILTAGAFVPAAQLIFEFLPKTVDKTVVYGVGTICIGLAMFIHLAGQAVLRGLR